MPGKKKKMIIIIFVAVIILAIVLWAIYLRGNPPLATNQVRINNGTWNVELATTMVQQMNGLSFRPSLPEDQGMLFLFTPGIQHFWMKDMHFPLDIIWISGNKVAGYVENAPPATTTLLWNIRVYNSPDQTDKVLEVNAGAIAKYNIKVGDELLTGK